MLRHGFPVWFDFRRADKAQDRQKKSPEGSYFEFHGLPKYS
jgi:hypothetical protein